MGIIKAGLSAVRNAAADQWKEAFMADEMGSDLLMTRAKRLTGQRSSNEGSGNVITDGSIIIVGEGECVIATEGGKIIGVYDQPGEQIFRSEQSSGIFGGGLGAFLKDVGQRISFGGDVTISQRLYYINTKELTGGTIRAKDIPLRYRDEETGLDMNGGFSCYGSYTFHIANPELFYKAAIRSQEGRYRKDVLKQMDSEVLTALSPALAEMTREGIRPSELLQHTETLCEKLRQVMSDQWSGLRGIEVFSLGLESMQVLDAQMIRDLQQDAILRDPTMAAGHIVNATGDAMRTAAGNEYGKPKPVENKDSWICFCGASGNTGKLCNEYGKSKPKDGWECTCGAVNKGKFCSECGAKKPAGIPQYQCDKCGWEPEDKAHPPKFCPECGDPFDDGDIK